MSPRFTVELVCDTARCAHVYRSAVPTVALAREHATQEGWAHDEDGDHCWLCVRGERRRQWAQEPPAAGIGRPQ